MFDLAWLMSKDLSDMLWCVGPSEQLGPRQCWLRPCPALVWGPGSLPDCSSCLTQTCGRGTAAHHRHRGSRGWAWAVSPSQLTTTLLLSKLECEV